MQPIEYQARKAMLDAQQPPFMRLPMVMRWTGLGRSTSTAWSQHTSSPRR